MTETPIAAQDATDPLLIEAREIVARAYQDRRDHDFARWIRNGDKDDTFEVQVALAALKRDTRPQGEAAATDDVVERMARAMMSVNGDGSYKGPLDKTALRDAEAAFSVLAKPAEPAADMGDSDAFLALQWALSELIKMEPGDSRAVSDEFVAAAAIQAGVTGRAEEGRQILRDAICRNDNRAASTPQPQARELVEAEKLVAAKNEGARQATDYRLNEARQMVASGGDSWGIADWDDLRDYLYIASKAGISRYSHLLRKDRPLPPEPALTPAPQAEPASGVVEVLRKAREGFASIRDDRNFTSAKCRAEVEIKALDNARAALNPALPASLESDNEGEG